MRLERITWVQAEEYFKTNDTVIIPLGSLESHGRHMPLLLQKHFWNRP